MVRKPNPALIDEDAPELTDDELASMRPAKEVLPPEFFEMLKREQQHETPNTEPAIVETSIRLDAGVLAAFKSQGDTWQQDVNAVLAREVQRRKRVAAKKTA